jgi:microcin C transport system substrate-binding protein
MTIGRRGILAGGAALWVGAPAVLRAQSSSKLHVGHGLAMHGEPKYGADAGPPDFVNPDAPAGGNVKFGTLGTYDSLHPFTLKGVPAAGIGALWETLCRQSPDEAFTVYGTIAETIECPDDRSWVAFTLRPQAKWHDGTPITPEDVVFSFDILKSKGHPRYAAYYADVMKAEKNGDAKVLFTFRNNMNRELPLILGQLPILPSKWWQGKDFDKVSLEPALGSGPYKVDSTDVGRSITYRRVPDWWAKDLWLNRGRNNFETIRYDYYRDNTIIFEAFKGGDTDIRRENSGRNWMIGYKDLPAVKDGRIQRAEIAHENPAPMQGFVFNTRRDMFKDRSVRQAIGLMYDFEWQNKNLSYGFYQRTRSYFGNCELEAKGLPSADELKILEPLRGKIPDEVFTAEYNPPKTDGSGNIRPQAREAIPLLKAAGWEIKNGKMTDKSGRKLAFEILLNDAAFEKMALPVKQNLDRIGIDMTIRTVDTSQYQRRTDTYDFDMIIDLWGESLSPGNEQRDYWGSRAADIQGGRNTIGIKDPAIDHLIALIIAAPDRDSLVTRTRALDRVLCWHMFVIPQFYSGKALVAYWNRFGRPDKTAKYEPLAFDSWWVDPAKDRALTRGEKK